MQEYQLGERPFAPGPAQGVSLTTPTKSQKKRSLSQSSLDSFLKAGQSSGTPQRKKKRLSLMLDKDSPRLKQQKTRSLTPKKPERKWSKEMLKKMLKRKGMTPKRKERLEGELKKIVEVEKEQRKAERDAERERTKEKRQKVGWQGWCGGGTTCGCAHEHVSTSGTSYPSLAVSLGARAEKGRRGAPKGVVEAEGGPPV